mgnify:FL=1
MPVPLPLPSLPHIVVERVIDGDTVELSQAVNGLTRVRIAGIDTPETSRAQCKRERDRGFEAKGYAAALLEGQVVVVTPSPAKDRYGRLLARLEVSGRDYGQTMIARGYAVRWTKEWAKMPKAQRWC